MFWLSKEGKERALLDAAREGHEAHVRRYLDDGVHIECTNSWNGLTPLYTATGYGHVDIVRLLLARGANMEAKDYVHRTPLHEAALQGHVSIARLLLAKGAEMEAIDNFGGTPLQTATRFGSLDIVHVLLENGANVDAADNYGQTPLHAAADRGHGEILSCLLQHGAKIDAKDEEGDTSLHLAASNDRDNAVRLLLEKGANVGAKDSFGRTALHRAAAHGLVTVVRLLIGHGADIEAKDADGATPLGVAASNGQLDVVGLLLENHADVEATDKDGGTPMSGAVRNDQLDIVRLLLQIGAVIDVKHKNGGTPLHAAARYGRLEIVRLLIGHGANVDAKDNNGSTPLHAAACTDRVDIVRLLVEKGADIDATTNSGETPLLLAEDERHVHVAQFLRGSRPLNDDSALVQALREKHFAEAMRLVEEETVDPNLRDDDGTPLLHIVVEMQHHRLLDALLRKTDLDVDATDASGRTALGLAMSMHHVAATLTLLGAGAAIDGIVNSRLASVPVFGTALLQAAYADDAKAVTHLVRLGVDPTTTQKKGNTALHIAAGNGHVATVATLLGVVNHDGYVNVINHAGESPLFVAAARGHADVVTALLHANASARAVTNDGSTLLHAAALGGNSSVFDQLLPLCSDVEACDVMGQTPLHVAATEGHESTVQYLLDTKANVFATTTAGETPLMLTKDERVLAILQHAETKVKQLYGAALVDAVCKRDYDQILALLSDGNGDSLLHLAVQSNDHKVLEALLRAPDIQLNICNATGATPMALAIQAGLRHITNLLYDATHAVIAEVSPDVVDVDFNASLGIGGYGAVYKGTYGGRTVAVKTALGPQGSLTLLKEMETMQRCHSPYVLGLLAVTTEPSPKLVLEYMNGGDLRSFLDAKRLGQPTKVDVSSLEVAWVVANALADMHHNGLLHRDIKSPNVLLCSTNYIKLADLGIAREYESNMTMGIGTLRWMAPELLNPLQKYNAAADMYAFGALLTELDTRLLPFAAETSVPTIMRKLGDGTLKPQFTPSCPAWLKDLATACLSFDAKMRPTAQEAINVVRKQLGRAKTDDAATVPEAPTAMRASAATEEEARVQKFRIEEEALMSQSLAPSMADKREDVVAEDMASGLFAQLSVSYRRPQSPDASVSRSPGVEPILMPSANNEEPVFGNTATYSGWTTEKLVATELVCQLCNTTNSLLDDTCATCAEPLPPSSHKLKVLLRRLDAAAKRGLRIDTTISCYMCSDAYPMTRAACDCGDEFPADSGKIRMLLKRIELAGSSKPMP